MYIASNKEVASPVSLYLCNDNKDILFRSIKQFYKLKPRGNTFTILSLFVLELRSVHSFAPFPTHRFLQASEKDSDSDTWIIGHHLKGVRASRSSPFTLLLAPRPIRPLWGAQEREGMIEIKGIVIIGADHSNGPVTFVPTPTPRPDVFIRCVCVVKWSFNES